MSFLDFTKFARVPFSKPDGTLTIHGQAAMTELQRRTGNAAGILSAADIVNVPSGGVAATDVQAAINELDFEKQTKDATLTGLAALTVAADTLPYGSGADTFSLTTFTPFARTLLDDVDAATMRATLGAGTGNGNGTVTTVSVVSANGFAGTVATPGTTPAITLTTPLIGLLKGNGTSMSAAVAGTDYVSPSSYATGIATFLSTPTSANLAAALTDETGTGSAVFGTAPDLTNASLLGTAYREQGAHVTKAAAATLTIAELLTGIVLYTGAAANLTLPTGANIDAGVLAGLANDRAFDFSVINTGSGTATVVTNTGLTPVGALAVAAGSSAHFRVRKTAASTYTVYRIA